MPSYQTIDTTVPTFSGLNDASSRAGYNRASYGDSDFVGEFMDPGELYGRESFFKYVADEVNALLDTLFCENRYLTAAYNPLYWVAFAALYILLLPGAYFHLMLLGYAPVRRSEFPEERDLRGQGIYTAMGAAIINVPFAIYGFTSASVLSGSGELQAENSLALALTLALVAMNMIGLVALSFEYTSTLRMYGMGAVLVVIFLVFLCLYEVTDMWSTEGQKWVIAVQYTSRVMLIGVYVVIYYQCTYAMEASDMEQRTRREYKDSDVYFTRVLVNLYVVLIACVVTAYVLAKNFDWGLL